jgi:Gpi18-like mannosyltransferase
VRAAAFVLRDYLVAAFLVSTLASLAAAELLWRLVARDHGEELADRAVWCLAAFPTAYFLHVPYTESLFLALVLGTFLAARSERWGVAGLLGFAAGLTRSAGIVLVPALLIEAFLQERAGKRARWGYFAADAPLLGLLVYLGVNHAVTGNAFRFLSIQKHHWYKSLAPPWVGLGQLAQNFDREASEAALLGGQEMLFAVLGLVTIAGAFAYMRASYAVWSAGNWLLYVGTTWVMSVPRYTLALFPIFALLAMAARRRTTALLLFAAGLLFQSLFAIRFALGLWAF